ncbi:MAG TPA: hypothetical protein VN697_08255 [Tepidiformaceae bacterium]|nr:hypothetical protein [Tepidiformaceae bacterium]
MTGTRRGFGNERHNHMKAVISFLAGGSFLVAWFGFAASHGAPAASGAVAGTATATAPDHAPLTTPTPRARTSRGS